MELEIAILSKQGGRNYNEDACGHWNSDRHLCCVMADGAGGHGGGDIASKLAVQSLLNGFAAQPADTPEAARALVLQANHAILEHRQDGAAQQHMHTTAVLLAIDFVDHTALWAHAGDSRLYWFRDGAIVTRTRDHSLVQALADGGLIRPEEMRTHPKRSELRSALGEARGRIDDIRGNLKLGTYTRYGGNLGRDLDNLSARLGDLVEIELDAKQFGRIAAQVFKQAMNQNLRSIEKTMIMEEFQGRVGDIVAVLAFIKSNWPPDVLSAQERLSEETRHAHH